MRDIANPAAVYRLFDASRNLLYVGVSVNPSKRFSQHGSTQSWWPLVDDFTLEWHESRTAALTAESSAIKSELPRFNTVHAVGDLAAMSSTFVGDLSAVQIALESEDAAAFAAIDAVESVKTELRNAVFSGVPLDDLIDFTTRPSGSFNEWEDFIRKSGRDYAAAVASGNRAARNAVRADKESLFA